MELRELITQKKPRENSGARSSNRFDFQQDWVICKLLELHRSSKDFLILLDYHEDVVVIDSEDNPEKMTFYQIKSKDDGNWTTSSLLKRKKGKNGKLPSILGKLYSCKLTFPKHTLSLNFVSNARYNISLTPIEGEAKRNGTNKKEICFNEIHDDEVEKIVKQIIEEHSLTDNPDFIDITFLQVTDLNINDRETYVKGKLSDFLEELNPEGKNKPGLVYKVLFDEVKRKTNYEYEVDSFDTLIQHKSIGKTNFSRMINTFTQTNSCEKFWDFTERQLSNEQISINVFLDLKNAWNKYEIERMDYSKGYLMAIKKMVGEIVKPYRKEKEVFKLYAQLVEPVYKEFLLANPNCYYDEFFVKAIILMEYYGI